MKFDVVLEAAEEGGFNVRVPALDGCYTQGETVQEALVNVKEAITCYLEGLQQVNKTKAKRRVLKRQVVVHI